VRRGPGAVLGFERGDHARELVGGLNGLDGAAEFLHVHQATDLGQGLDVWAGLVGRADEQDDEGHRPAVDAVEVDRLGRLAGGHDELAAAIGLPVRDGQAVADAGGALGLTLEHGLQGHLPVQQRAGLVEQVDQLGDHADLVGRTQRHADVIGGETHRKFHARALTSHACGKRGLYRGYGPVPARAPPRARRAGWVVRTSGQYGHLARLGRAGRPYHRVGPATPCRRLRP
jgi:hypothetical protein